MSLKPKETRSSVEPVPAGTHLAICCQVIDLGTQFSPFYQKSSHKVLVGWELVDEKDDADEPRLVWNRYTSSLHQNSKLREHLEAWRGRAFTHEELQGFDLTKLLGKACLVNITHNEGADGNTYANVGSVMALPKGTNVPTQYHNNVVFDLDNWSQPVFDTFSDHLKETIRKSEEYQRQLNGDGHQEGEPDSQETQEDQIPF